MKYILLFILSLFIFSCSSHQHDHNHGSHDEHAHDEHTHENHVDNTEDNHNSDEPEHHHEDVSQQIIAYTDVFELFAEADPFIPHSESAILAHFTHLPSFKPLEKGSVTVQLIKAKDTISQTINKPLRTGIYQFTLTPKSEGNAKLRFIINTNDSISIINIPLITIYASEDEAFHDLENKVASETNAVFFTKEQSWKVDFKTEMPKREPFGQVIRTTGQVQSSQADEVIVSAKMNGVVNLGNSDILEGTFLNKNSRLFSISGSGLADDNATIRFQEAKNNYDKAKQDYDRASRLAQKEAISEKELLDSKAEYKNAQIIYKTISKNFNASGQEIISPIKGYVKQLFIKNGQYVVAGQPIVSISQNKSLIIKTEIQQKYASILGAINSATIRTLHDNKTYSLDELNGKLLSYGRNTNSNNFLIPLNLQIDNKGSFIGGGFVEVYLKTLTNAKALTVPNSALLEEQGVYFVFVQKHPELFEKREVKIGKTDGIRTEITDGLSQNERIVSTGTVLVKLAQSSSSLDAHSGHVH